MEAEKCGFDSFWFSDHLIDDNIDLVHGETWTSLAVAVIKTRRIRLGSSVTNPFRRHPNTIAQTVATLDQISSGRAILGLGAGDAMNLLPFGVEFDQPVARLTEQIVVIKKLWRGTNKEPARFNGEILLMDASIQILPVQKLYPAIHVGALSKQSNELRSESVDGWTPWTNSPRSEIAELEKGSLAITAAGRFIGCPAGLATIEEVEKRRLSQNAVAVGDFMRTRLRKMMETHEMIGEVRGRGPLTSVEIVKDRKTKTPAIKEIAVINRRAFEKGLVTVSPGLNGNVFRIMPSLTLTKKQAGIGLDILEESFQDFEKGRIVKEAPA